MLIYTILILFLAYIAFHKNRTRGMPPGPFPMPIIGNLHQLGKMPFKTLRGFSKKYGGLTTIFMGSVPTVLISDTNLIREIMIKNSDMVIDRYMADSGYIIGQERNLLFSKGSFWIKYRKVFNQAMLNTKKHNITQRIVSQATGLSNYFATYARSGQPINPHDYIRKYGLNGVLDYSFSDSVEYEGDSDHIVIKAADIMEEIIATGNPQDYISFLKPFYSKKRNLLHYGCSQVWDYCLDAIKVHRKTLNQEKPRDLLDLILIEIDKSEEKSFYDDDSLAKCLSDLIIAGHETVAITVGWVLLFLVNHPEHQERVYEELVRVVGKGNIPTINNRRDTSFLNAVIQETMRIRTAAPLALPRVAMTDISAGGYTIPKGTQILMSVYGLASDDRYWDEPEVFKPQRWMATDGNGNTTNEAFIPFGVGPRMCVGAGVAKDEVYYCVAQMFMNFKWSSVDGKKIDDEGYARMSLEYNQYNVKVESR